MKSIKKLAVIGLFLFVILSSCNEEKGCPDGMEECTVNGDEICVPEGQC